MSKKRLLKILRGIVIWIGAGSLLNLFGVAFMNSASFRVYGTALAGLAVTLYVLRVDSFLAPRE
jgi:hypothetical protein